MHMFFSKPQYDKCHDMHGSKYYEIFTLENAPIAGCSAGFGVYPNTEYAPLGVHQDNEGFFVVRGKGKALIGAQEETIAQGSFFYAPAGEPHALKKDVGSENLEVLLFHFPK